MWRAVRAGFLERMSAEVGLDPLPCLVCGTVGDLEVHHVTYERWGGQELDEDLVPLCGSCHAAVHGLEDRKARNRNAELRRVTWAYVDEHGPAYPWPFLPREAPEGELLVGEVVDELGPAHPPARPRGPLIARPWLTAFASFGMGVGWLLANPSTPGHLLAAELLALAPWAAAYLGTRHGLRRAG